MVLAVASVARLFSLLITLPIIQAETFSAWHLLQAKLFWKDSSAKLEIREKNIRFFVFCFFFNMGKINSCFVEKLECLPALEQPCSKGR